MKHGETVLVFAHWQGTEEKGNNKTMLLGGKKDQCKVHVGNIQGKRGMKEVITAGHEALCHIRQAEKDPSGSMEAMWSL